MLDIYTLEDKFEEFLQYVDVTENRIPTQSSNVLFSDNTRMGFYFSNNEIRIRAWLADEDVLKFPTAAAKLKMRIERLDISRRKFHESCRIAASETISNEHSSTEAKIFVKK